MRYAVDGSWQRFGRVVVAGSPLRVFRLTDAGRTVAVDIERGADVPTSTLVERLLDGGAIHPDVAATEASDEAADGHRYRLDDVTIVTPQLGGVVVDDSRVTVDDGSQPPLEGATIRRDRTGGPAAARNAARDRVRTELVAFLDADVAVAPEGHHTWLAPLLAHLDDPRVGLVAPRVLGEPSSPLDMGSEPARVRAGSRVSYVPAAAIVVRRSALDQVGWFDESLHHGEDVDLVWRLDDLGWTCRYEPRSTVWHAPRPTLAARLGQRVDYGASAAPLALHHPGKLAPIRVNGWTAASWVLLATGRAGTAVALAVGSALALPRKLPGVPPTASVELAARGHLLAGTWLAAALRREWFPLLAVACLVSKRARLVALAAFAVAPRRAVTDAAYGVGVWRGMLRHRTLSPIVPAIDAWPGRPVSRSRRPPRSG